MKGASTKMSAWEMLVAQAKSRSSPPMTFTTQSEKYRDAMFME